MAPEKCRIAFTPQRKEATVKFRPKKLLPAPIRRWMLRNRRKRNHHRLVGLELFELTEQKWKYDEDMERWLRRRDKRAQESAQHRLAAMRAIVARFAKNGHRKELKELEAILEELKIPGMKPYLRAPHHPARRR